MLKLISWKNSFKRLNEEYETAKKKKEALHNLLNSGRISQSTFDLFNNEINEGIAELEREQKALLDKMSSKMRGLEEQIKTLEMLFANFEIQHVTAEVDDEVYQREITPLSMGLETAKQELDAIREAMNQLSSDTEGVATNAVVQPDIEPQSSEVSQAEAEAPQETVPQAEEKLPKPEVDIAEGRETNSNQIQQEKQQETLQATEETKPT